MNLLFNMVSAFDEIEITYILQYEIKNISNIEDIMLKNNIECEI